jgi:hypothetical protein
MISRHYCIARRLPVLLVVAGVLVSVFSLTTCSNPMLTTIQSVVAEYQRPAAEINFTTGSGLAQNTVITVTFSKSMDTSGVVIGGDLWPFADAATWRETIAPDDTLTIRPVSQWPTGSGKTLTISGSATDTYGMEPLEVTYGVLDGIVYVHADDGNDNNPGTIDQPKRTISSAISTAERVYDTADIHVAGGVYQVTSTTIVNKNISIYGGYDPENWSVRDPDTYETSWLDIRTSGTHETLSYTPNVADTVVLDGLTIAAGNGSVPFDGTAAIFVSGASVEITNNRIVTGIAGRAYGLAAQNAELLVQNNEFETEDLDAVVNCINASGSTVSIADNSFTGEWVSEFYGVLLEDSDGVIERNVINAGQPLSLAQCISIDAGTVTIRNNVISAGTMVTDSVIGQYGIYLNNCNVTIHNNTIDGGGGMSADGIMTTAIMLFFQVQSVIENNVIFTTSGDLRTGVWQVDNASFPDEFNNNVMFDCPDGNYYHDPSVSGYVSNVATLESFLNGNGTSAANNAFETSGNLTGAPEYRPQASSPATIQTGGKTLSGFSDDVEGTTRTAPWSTGAYEY